MLYLYNENLFVFNRAKNFIKRLLGKQNRGPKAVALSLEHGLRELERDFCTNKKKSKPIDIACVLSGAKTLKWAISQKKQGKIKKIIAGPNIVVFPDNENGVLKHPLIDTIIVPSVWVKELYCKLAPEIENKIRIWPSGVIVPKILDTKKDFDFLVYDKTKKSQLYEYVVKYLKESKFNLTVLDYGKFQQKDYFDLLSRCSFEIYLSESESQGLAMFEAWVRNVPTLVWETGEYKKRGTKINGKISSPFLNSKLGLSFSGVDDFKNKLEIFLKKEFYPRNYVEENYTNKICTQKYLDIIYE